MRIFLTLATLLFVQGAFAGKIYCTTFVNGAVYTLQSPGDSNFHFPNNRDVLFRIYPDQNTVMSYETNPGLGPIANTYHFDGSPYSATFTNAEGQLVIECSFKN